MAVRFVPSEGDETSPTRQDRADLAEVIEFRSRLPRSTNKPRVEGGSRESSDPPVIGLAARKAERGAASRLERAREALVRAETDADSGSEGSAAESHAAEVSAAEASVAEVSAAAADAATDPEDAAARCSEDAVRLLARKARSRGELRRELFSREHSAGDIEDVLDEFERSYYLDDLGLARTTMESLRERKRASRTQIRVKLRERQLSDHIIETVLAELDDDEEHELLRTAAEERARRLADLDRQTAERRLLGFLARRGWSGERAARAAREALDNVGSLHTSSGVRFR
ncbi:regulatory protein RecX [Leucobacter sp. GX24907]